MGILVWGWPWDVAGLTVGCSSVRKRQPARPMHVEWGGAGVEGWGWGLGFNCKV